MNQLCKAKRAPYCKSRAYKLARICGTLLLFAGLLCTLAQPAEARRKSAKGDTLAEYLAHLATPQLPASIHAPGSLWPGDGGLTDLSRDYKAHRVGDLVEIVINTNTVAQNSGSVSTDRSFSATSGISALANSVSTSAIQQLFSPQAAQKLSGKSAAASSAKLTTALAGQIVAVLPGGTMVVEAERQILMNNERETVILRGLVRPGDVQSDNSVASTSLANLQVELKGRGVLSDGTRPPNPVVRLILRIVGF